MSKLLPTLIIALAMAAAYAQENADEDAVSGDVATSEDNADEVVADADEEVDDADLDVQTYEEDDDDFIPSEEIPADEPIPFPSNI